jgi:hypothetical protein
MDKYKNGVNAANNWYWMTGKNSNSFTAGAVKEMTGKEWVPLPDKDLPGYNVELDVKQ